MSERRQSRAHAETRFRQVKASLQDLLGAEYIRYVVAARASLTGEDAPPLRRIAREKVDFFPQSLERRLASMLSNVGAQVVRGWASSSTGTPPNGFSSAAKPALAPLSGLGYYRIGERGRLYLVSKSEHYHTPLGHSFPGYRLLDHARGLGIPNATHNNTRGFVTRRLEEQLIGAANGLDSEDEAGLARVLRSRAAGVLNRVLNLQTGSLAVEAALKMILARFYRVQPESPTPKYAGRTPVLLVMGDDEGAPLGNYHGTTILTQAMRGMWPDLLQSLQQSGVLRLAAVRPNRTEDLDAAFERFDSGDNKIAGFFHELVMMNYGARRLDPRFIRKAYRLCRAHDVPTLVDEIQTCVWSPELLMFREYGLRPDFVAVGKGLPGGEYAASRLLFSAKMDNLPQFGALVTNGQEELSSLAYLVTMRWVRANGDAIRAIGEAFEAGQAQLADRYPHVLASVEGKRHLSALRFRELEPAQRFVATLTHGGIDVSVQSYKATCPPVALTKLPVIVGPKTVEFILTRMDEALAQL
jgi:acetylornithine/succinyldiaminopimelate/putrescine aminotransferase